MVSKRADGVFQSGRSSAWLKVKCVRRQEMVIGGYTDPEGSRVGLGALLLGVYESDGRLTYSGKVGTGFNDKSLAMLTKRLQALAQDTPPFHNPPAAPKRAGRIGSARGITMRSRGAKDVERIRVGTRFRHGQDETTGFAPTVFREL